MNLVGQLRVNGRCFRASVPHLGLYCPQVKVTGSEVCAIAVAQAVRRNVFMDVAAFDYGFKRFL